MSRPYNVIRDQGNIPVPQIEDTDGQGTQTWKGQDNAGYVYLKGQDGDLAVSMEDRDITTFTEFDRAQAVGVAFVSTIKLEIPANSEKYIGLETEDSLIDFGGLVITNNVTHMEVELFEGASYTDGTIQDIISMNRNTSEGEKLVIVNEPTVTSDGNLLLRDGTFGAAGQGGTRSGSKLTNGVAWRLKPNTKYLAKIINESSNDGIFYVSAKYCLCQNEV